MFKGQKVWVEVRADGSAAANAGRVPIRYQASAGAKIYRASFAGLGALDGAIEDLPDGVDADAPRGPRPTPGTNGSGFGSAGSRTAAQAEAAARAAADIVAQQAPGTVLAFADGSCRGNPGPAGSGALVVLPDGRRGAASLSLGRGTNNIAELSAVDLVLDLLDEARVLPAAPVALLTDSRYAVGVLTQGWKAKANAELIGEVRQRLRVRPGVRLHWIAGHAGIEGNEHVDGLANAAVDGLTRTAWSG
jgi:ribonuclease HI